MENGKKLQFFATFLQFMNKNRLRPPIYIYRRIIFRPKLFFLDKEVKMKMKMNNATIKAYEVEDGPIKKIVINIDLDELDKHPEILGQETTNGLKILNLMSYCSVDLKTAYEYAEGSESLTAVVDNIYETFKNLLGYDVAESAKRLGVDGYVMALNRKERLIANELARFTNDDPATLKDKLNDIVNLLAAGASIPEMAKKTHTPEGMIKIYLQELKK